MAADPGKEVLLQAKEERSGSLQATRKFKAEAHTGNHPNDPAAELFESGGSSSSGTWMASDACDAFSNGSNDSGSNGSSECVDCDPGSLRLRSLLQAAARERSASLTSSCCDGESESEEKESEQREQEEEEVGGGGWGEEGPPRFVARAASARKFMERRARDSSGDSAAAAVLASGAGGGGDNAAAAAAAPGKGADADVEGAAALAAALEAVLLCPPQVLARNTSYQGQGSFLSSLLTPTSEPSDRADDHPCTRGRAASGDGNEDGTGNSEGDDEAAEDAVKAALAWSFPVPKLPRVEEESGVAVDEGETTIAQGEGKDRRTVSENLDIVTSSAPGSRSNAMPESVAAAAAAAAEGGRASDSALVVAGHREGFDVVDGDHGVCGRASGGEGGGSPPLAVSSGGGGGGGSGSGGKERRRASLTSNSSGEPDADTLPPSPVVSGTPNAKTTSDVCEAAEASSAAASSSAGVSPTVTPTGTAGGGFPPRDTGHERSPKQGGVVYSKTAADDDSGSVEDDGGDGGGGGDNDSKVRQSSFGSAGSSGPPSDRRSNQRARWGSMNMSEFSTEDAPPSATAMATEREKLILSVFGRQAGAAELATVGRSNSCHVFLEAASRIAALPPLDRSLLAELDRSSDDEGDGDGDGDGGISGPGDVVASRPRAKESAPSSEGAAAEKASPGSRELPMSRVGYAEADPDAAGAGAAPTTTAYRYRRLAGNSGRGWPPRVDPARREEWLCPIEFEAVFGMTFAAFRDLPSWKQIRLKQEVHLF